MNAKQILVSRAWIAKKLKRYDDLYACMRAVSQSGESLNKKDRTLFYLAYQHLLKPYRDGWYKLLVISRLIDGSQRKMQLTKEYKDFVERQWMEYSMEAINAIDTLLVRAKQPRPKIFYLKMRADLTRYLIEISGSAKARRKRLLKETKSAYVEASQLCDKKLSPIHPLRLAVALNHAVYLAHVRGKKEVAIALAKAAFTEAEKKLAQSQDKSEITSKLKKVTALLQLLRDNVAFWAPRGSDEDEINEPILKSESIKEAKLLSRNDYTVAGAGTVAGGKSKAMIKGKTEGKYGRPTLVDEYEADMAEEASALANQIVLIEQFKSPPLSEELSSTSEDENEELEEQKEEDLEPRLSELLKDEEENLEVVEEETQEEEESTEEEPSEEEEESEEEENEGDLHLDGEGQVRKSSAPVPEPGPTKLAPPGGIVPYVFTPSEDDLLYKKVQQEEEYLAELAANKATALQRNKELIAIKAATKATESELDTASVPSKSTTVLGEKLSDEGSTPETSESEDGEDDWYPSDNDQEAEDRLVEQILDEFFKAEFAKIPKPGDESSSMSESCASSVSSMRSASPAAAGSKTTLASSYSGATSILSRSTVTSEQRKRKASKAKVGPEKEVEEETEIVEEEVIEPDEEEPEGVVEEPEDELEEKDQLEPSDSLLDIQSLGSDSDLMDNYFDDHDQDDSAHIDVEEPESEEEEEEEEENVEEEEEAEQPSGSRASVDTSGKSRKHKRKPRSHSRAGSIFGSEELSTSSEESRASPVSIASLPSVHSGSVSFSSASTKSAKDKAFKKSKKRAGAGDYFHPLPPGPNSAFDQRKYVDKFQAVVQKVEAGLDDFEFSPEQFKEIDRVLDYLEDHEERREIAESEGRRMEAREMIVEDPLVTLMFTDFRIVYPEYDHDITAGVSIADEDYDDESGEESEDEAKREQRRMSVAGPEREDAATRNEAEDKAEIECLLEYPDDFKDYEEAHFTAEYVKIEQPVRRNFGRYEEFRGEYEYGGEYDGLEEVDAILQPRATAAGAGPAGPGGGVSHASIYDTLVTTKSSRSIHSVRPSAKEPRPKSKTRVSAPKRK